MLRFFIKHLATVNSIVTAPEIGFGTFIEQDHEHLATVNSIVTALRIGYRHMDLAENYNNLSAVMEALTIAFKPTSDGGLGLRRDELWITMKSSVKSEVEIQRLMDSVGVDYFDLYLIHNPTWSGIFDSKEKLRNEWEILSNNPKLLNIGVSNFYEPHLRALLCVCEENETLRKPYANQIQMSVGLLEPETMDICVQHGIHVIAYSPLGYLNSPCLLQREIAESFGTSVLHDIAEEINATPAQVALAWLMNKNVAVIPKSIQEERLLQNFLATDVKSRLQPTHMQALDTINLGVLLLSRTAEEAKCHGDQIEWSQTSGLRK